MISYEKGSFWKFFSIYFASVALLILAAGYFYFKQQKEALIAKEQFSIIWYARMLKTTEYKYQKEGFSYKVIDRKIKNFNPQNLRLSECCIEKIVPSHQENRYLLIQKSRSEFDAEIGALKVRIAIAQLLLLAIFGAISALLAHISLRPMRDTILRLDHFAKDLIHDLNTPITSILLNIKLLKKDDECREKRELMRIEKSAEEISSLYKNLNVLLEERTFKVERIDLSALIADLVEIYSLRFPSLHISFECREFRVKANQAAMRQLLHNLLTNACKYNRKDGSVEIWCDGGRLYIKDNGPGIERVDMIFNRHYKEQSGGSGIGLHIVKTLCDAMGIEIEAESKKGFGTLVILTFPD